MTTFSLLLYLAFWITWLLLLKNKLQKPRNMFRGRFPIVVKDREGRVVRAWTMWNNWTTVGKNDILTQYLTGGTAPTIYIGLIDNSSFSALDATDTMGSHAGWDELTGYDEATRPAITFGNIDNYAAGGGPVTFTGNATESIIGAFITTNSTKGGTTGILIATATDTQQDVIDNQTVNVSYLLEASP